MIWPVAAVAALSGAAADVLPCERLASLALPDTAIARAQIVAAGQFSVPDGRADRSLDPGALLCAGASEQECLTAQQVASTIDLLGAIDRWVESDAAPARIDAARQIKGVVDRTRPLCPCPQVATYLGSGSIDGAGRFVCR